MSTSPRITVDDLDTIAALVPRRERHRLAHHLNRRLCYATDSPGRTPYGLRRPYNREQWARLPEVQRIEVVTRHLVAQWIEDGKARHRSRPTSAGKPDAT